MARMDGLSPRTRRNSGWKIWKNGGLVSVGLKCSSKAFCRKRPLSPKTLYVRELITCSQ